MKEQLKENLKQVGIEEKEFEETWSGFFQEAVKGGMSEEDAKKKATTNTRRYYRKVAKEPAVLYEGHTYIGCSNMTDWADIGRRHKQQPKDVPQEKLTYVAGYNKDEPIPKHSFDKTYYFMKPDGEMYNVRSRKDISWKEDIETEEEATEKEKKIMEQFFPNLEFGKKYKFRVQESTRNDGTLARYFASHSKFEVCGTAEKQEILGKFRKLDLIDIGNMPELPETFVINVDVIDINESFGSEKVLVEDESIINDMTANYTVKFEKGVFKVPEEGKAEIIVKPIHNKTGEFVGMEGVGYFSDDIVEAEEPKEEDWMSGGD